jgi:hypothetical protein
VPLVTKQAREEFNGGAALRDGFLAKLEKDTRKYQAASAAKQGVAPTVNAAMALANGHFGVG